MEFKHQILNALTREMAIISHLASKITLENIAFRLFPETRSIRELMEYLTYCAITPTKYYLEKDLSLNESYKICMKKYAIPSTELPTKEFVIALYEQFAEIRHLFVNITDHDLLTKKVKMPWPETMLVGEAILHTTVKYLTAYRMQLFLALKMSGAKELNTIDCWIGNKEEMFKTVVLNR